MKTKTFVGLVLAAVVLLAINSLPAAEPAAPEMRLAAHRAMAAGNFKDAYASLAALAVDPADDAAEVSDDLSRGINCLDRLGREDEVDDFREKTVAAHGDNWRLLWTAAKSYQNEANYGFIIAGKFYRGGRRGNDGRWVNCMERDRIRMLQLMQLAMAKQAGETKTDDLGEFYLSFADMLLEARAGWFGNAWRLQYLSDLTTLPDYEDRNGLYRNTAQGAPANADGTPVYHAIPKSWQESQTDGQRWRWCLQQAAAQAAAMGQRATLALANFLHAQFDVQTMAGYGLGRISADDEKKNESGPYAVSTLAEDETIARLAVGIRRFKLPDEFNFIKLYQQLADAPKSDSGEQASNALGEIFENRQQYDRSAEFWKQAIAIYGPGPNGWRQQRLDQILGNWGNFDPLETEPVGPSAHASLIFRNGKKISFTATEIDVAKLLADVKTYLKANPKALNYQQVEISNIGYRLVTENQKQYLGPQAAQWDMDLTPREKHFDRRVRVEVPIKKPGAYLLAAHMESGNTSQIVLWMADTAIVKKTLEQGSYYYVADAVTGKPLANAKLDFFGYQQKWIEGNHYEINTKQFTDAADDQGQCVIGGDRQPQGFQWMVTANTAEGRSAYCGFYNIWDGGQMDAQYNQNKCFVITDRPVYRPGQTVKYKIWLGQAKYDQAGKSPFANQIHSVLINDPRNEKKQEKSYQTDAYGGMEGEYTLPRDATPGVYAINIMGMGGGTFRVEEYKKPEFEVKVDAPTEPVMLGEKITATIAAKYYFGAPVHNAKVKYKVLRSSYASGWFPIGRWDWFYEPGYWWFGQDYLWYPGFGEWGCLRPIAWWWGRGFAQPEVVAENEVPIGVDGTVKVEIDTGPAKALFGNTDHRYQVTAEVTDESRRTIVGQGEVLVARKPFKVYVWVNRGYFQPGDAVDVELRAQTLAQKPVKGTGELKLFKIAYKDNQPVETEVQKWAVDTNEDGQARQQIKAAAAGQYRLSYTLTDDKSHAIEGGYVLLVRGPGFDGKDFRFNDVELIPDKKEYQPGDSVHLLINTNRADATVLLFERPSNGVYLPPKILNLTGKSTVEDIGVVKKDMPNFFVEAVTIGDGKVYQEDRDVVVPPESRVINVQVTPSSDKYKPGDKASVTFKLTDADGKPVVGTTAISIYDKAVEYISGGSNVPEIKAFFWKWRRNHYPRTESSLDHRSAAVFPNGAIVMSYLGVFGYQVADLDKVFNDKLAGLNSYDDETVTFNGGMMQRGGAGGFAIGGAVMHSLRGAAAPMAAAPASVDAVDLLYAAKAAPDAPAAPGPDVQPTVRANFADTAFWKGTLLTDADGTAKVDLTMPESLTTWKARVWAMGDGTRVGEGTAEVVTFKNLIVRLQAPRFFVQKDRVILSANVHNYLKTDKSVRVTLDLGNSGVLAADSDVPAALTQTITVPANGEKRVDFAVKVLSAGQPTVRVSALTDEESDAMEMPFPAYIHGMLKTDSFAGAMRPEEQSATLNIVVPSERLVPNSRLEIRYSPSVAMAMVDALPYLVDYPYDTTDATLYRFLPTVITQKVLLDMHLDLKDIRDKQANLNAQEIGDDKQRAEDWKRVNPPNPGVSERNPVFDEATVKDMASTGMAKLSAMELGDGGWGWFFGWGEHSWPHTTALVVHGLQVAKGNGIAVQPEVMDRGVQWLKNYQAEQIRLLKNFATKTDPWKQHADNLDALVYMVLADGKVQDKAMMDFVYRDRNELSVYAKAMFGLALLQQGEKDKLDMILQNCAQYVVQDNENQTAFLRLPADTWWWCWYGSETESNGYYLKLLAKIDPKGPIAPRLAKYLITNRKHGSYWDSTRDTAVCIEALADYIRASGEDKPDLTVGVFIDGVKKKEVAINAANLFSYDNKLVLTGEQVPAGKHEIRFVKAGTGPLYFNAYLTNFTLEDPITKAGLEIKVQRKFYKLVETDAKTKVEGAHGQALEQRTEKYTRQDLPDGAVLKSGDLVEVELEIDSKNDYEYLLFEDLKAAGFEPMEVRSGYNGNDLNAYMELHDERVCFFCRALARGKHSVSYRLRAEIPGTFSALPTRASALYAPELKANADEAKLGIAD